MNEQKRIAELTKLVKAGQSQQSLTDQLRVLQRVANFVGLYDAADYIQNSLERTQIRS